MSEKSVGRIAEHIPLVTIVVLISGYINIHSYYSSFGISIYTYLDPSEIVFSFSSIAFELLVAALLFGGYMFFNYMNYRREIARQTKKSQKLYLGGMPSILFIFVSILASVIATYFIYPISPFLELFLFFMVTVIIPTFVFYEHFLRRDRFFRRAKFTWAVLFSFIFYTIFILQINFNENAAISAGIDKYDVHLIMNDQREIYTSDNLIYLGSTRNYHFFRNLSSKMNLIVPKQDVKEERQEKLR